MPQTPERIVVPKRNEKISKLCLGWILPLPTHNEALLEAYASCPPSARIYYTLEIWQSSFASPARVVANVGNDMVFGIEAGAPRDGGAMVMFTLARLRRTILSSAMVNRRRQRSGLTMSIASSCRRSALRWRRENISRSYIGSISAAI